MCPLAVLPSKLVVRPYKGMNINMLDFDIELDRISLNNSLARQRRARREG
jgi:hypothetical protein